MKANHVLALLLAAGLTVGCGDRAEENQAEPTPVVPRETDVPFDSLPMPAVPEPRRGYLVATGAGMYALDGAWEAQAQMCEDPPMLEVLAEQPGIGTLVLLQLPSDGERLTDYPVAIVEQGAPDPPASQIGVQTFQQGGAHGFQAMEGSVSVYGFDERISGRFTVILREISSNDLQKYAGVFHGIPVAHMSDAECLEWKAALATIDSTSADSLPQ